MTGTTITELRRLPSSAGGEHDEPLYEHVKPEKCHCWECGKDYPHDLITARIAYKRGTLFYARFCKDCDDAFMSNELKFKPKKQQP